jgi:hypothetical protein
MHKCLSALSLQPADRSFHLAIGRMNGTPDSTRPGPAGRAMPRRLGVPVRRSVDLRCYPRSLRSIVHSLCSATIGENLIVEMAALDDLGIRALVPLQ